MSDWNECIFNATWSNLTFSVTTYDPIAEDGNIYANNTRCTPERATYTLGIAYENNIQTTNTSIGPVAPLDFKSPAPINSDQAFWEENGWTMDCVNSSGQYFGYEALNWTTPFVDWYRDLQLLSLIHGMAESLAGNVTLDSFNTTSSNATIVESTKFNPAYGVYGPKNQTALLSTVPPNDSLALNQYFTSNNSTLETYTITPELLNQALLNITLSVIVDFGWWKTSVDATQWKPINIYTFSKPGNLYIPYFLSLVLSIPILILGAFALHRNGVAAMDGGFIQLVTTSTGSKALDKAAAGGCLGGNESVTEELKELKIRFGELVDARSEDVGDNNLVMRAGFGTEEETTALKKGMLYGG